MAKRPGSKRAHHVPKLTGRELIRGDAELVAQLPDGCAAGARHRAGGHVGVGVLFPQRAVRQRVTAAGVGPHSRERDLRRRALLQQQAACERWAAGRGGQRGDCRARAEAGYTRAC